VDKNNRPGDNRLSVRKLLILPKPRKFNPKKLVTGAIVPKADATKITVNASGREGNAQRSAAVLIVPTTTSM